MLTGAHIFRSITPELPQPGSRHLPATAKAIANGHVLIKSHKDNIIENRVGSTAECSICLLITWYCRAGCISTW